MVQLVVARVTESNRSVVYLKGITGHASGAEQAYIKIVN